MANSIADQVDTCLQAFDSLITVLSDQDSSKQQEARVKFVDELDRFKVWAGNIGAHRRGQSSLDYRLRDASHIRQRVLKFLSKLRSSIEEGKTYSKIRKTKH
jgi:hypothetical protein